jgi:N-acetylglucosamine kinase-like BadF-type ATPase
MTDNFFLGVDIGATKSHALVANGAGKVLGFAGAGPGNHEVVGYDGLIEVLNQIVSQALHAADVTTAQVRGAGFGVAGYDWPIERQPTLEAIATLGLSCPLEAVNDAVVGLIAGASQGWGVGVVAGTSQNCWGWDRNLRTGNMTGHEMLAEAGGSGSLVLCAVQQVAKAWGKRGPQTALTDAFMARLGVASADKLLEGLSMETLWLGPDAAPLVFDVARAGDEVALGCIRWAAEELASMVGGVTRQLAFEDLEFEVVMIGSMFNGGELLIEPFRRAVWRVAPRAAFVRLDAPPVVGGVLLGMQVSGSASEGVRESLLAGI